MPKSSPKTRGGKGLSKKVGPFPIYILLGAGGLIVIFYLYYRKRNSGTGNQIAGSLNQQTIPSGVVIPPSQGTTDTTSTTPTDSTTSTPLSFPYDFATNTDLQSGLDNLHSQVASDIASITFPQPNVTITNPPSVVNVSTTQSKAAAKKALPPSPLKYYTYKTKVPLKAGQTLHFASGKGYYAA